MLLVIYMCVIEMGNLRLECDLSLIWEDVSIEEKSRYESFHFRSEFFRWNDNGHNFIQYLHIVDVMTKPWFVRMRSSISCRENQVRNRCEREIKKKKEIVKSMNSPNVRWVVVERRKALKIISSSSSSSILGFFFFFPREIIIEKENSYKFLREEEEQKKPQRAQSIDASLSSPIVLGTRRWKKNLFLHRDISRIR